MQDIFFKAVMSSKECAAEVLVVFFVEKSHNCQKKTTIVAQISKAILSKNNPPVDFTLHDFELHYHRLWHSKLLGTSIKTSTYAKETVSLRHTQSTKLFYLGF